MWLVKLAKPQEGDEDKVFALKILRKCDGGFSRATSENVYNTHCLFAVIKLKQVEHVGDRRIQMKQRSMSVNIPRSATNELSLRLWPATLSSRRWLPAFMTTTLFT